MIEAVHPALIFILGALLIPVMRPVGLRKVWQVLVPAVGFVNLLLLKEGNFWSYRFLTYDLVLGRIDKLSLCFAYVFVIMAFLGMVYALHVRSRGQHAAAFLYIGSTLGVTFAGDLFSLFAFWEMMATSSVFLIWYQKTSRALSAGFRYLLVHLAGGAVLLAGIVIYVSQSGSVEFQAMGGGGIASQFVLVAFLINAAVPPFHAWLSDAYPEATVTGSVFLTAFTTKSAVYVLLRGFSGTEVLIWLGAIMALYGVVYAVLENDIRRLLAYHIISQVGYMVCGVGLGTAMAMNGSIAHAFCHILYKALLFMGVGAVIEVTGRRKMTELQGRNLYKQMPICFSLYMIGAFSISAVPLFNGFVSKTMVVAAAGEAHRPFIHLLLHLASIGTFLHTGLKLPYGVWFGRAPKGHSYEELKAGEPPTNMLVAMAMAAFLCVFTGVYPKVIYDLLPFPVTFEPYTPFHVVGMMQLLLATAAAFWLLIGKLGGEPTISVDTDWFYRKGSSLFLIFSDRLNRLRTVIQDAMSLLVVRIVKLSRNPRIVFQPAGKEQGVSRGKFNRFATYDPNRSRKSIGVGVFFFVILFSLVCVILL